MLGEQRYVRLGEETSARLTAGRGNAGETPCSWEFGPGWAKQAAKVAVRASRAEV
ncbi:hypothetical protein [Nonomuraea dietziae]|uniref:hypothetical protein n=1 Tax=Nonomuraea dietziae TaxID=65515 RepID=UPI0033F509F8